MLQKNTDETNLWCDYSKTVSIPQTSDEYVPIILVDQYKELILLNKKRCTILTKIIVFQT